MIMNILWVLTALFFILVMVGCVVGLFITLKYPMKDNYKGDYNDDN